MIYNSIMKNNFKYEGSHKLDQQSLDLITKSFFDVFDNRANRQLNLDLLYQLCLFECKIIKTCDSTPVIYDLKSFIEPRKELLNDGSLQNFHEWEVSHQTHIYGRIAQRFSQYQKSGVLNGQDFNAKGTKSIQYVKVDSEWKISSVIWDDENAE